ncbi:hypothetical protein DFP72DRAFT_850843 [Ephemerocybe angulata]|uniref:Uncharacterized protein n=1 Tax=Ephemerocybe angulata TaxID=980116 RepID=A0A8H6HQQ1_9AGAR|nr:hypothetical protein DFP72DRAFT_850843 [Tulosesus angulatus]
MPGAAKPVTRAGNKNSQPYSLHTAYDVPRRPSSVVQAEKKKLADEKRWKEEALREGEKLVAQIEHEARKKSAARRANPGKVFDTELSIPKATNKRPGSPTKAAEKENKRRRTKKVIKTVVEEVTASESEGEEDEHGISKAEKAALAELDDVNTEDEFVPAADDDDDDDDDDMDEVELDEDETDIVLDKRKVKVGVKEKKGVAARHRIEKLRDALSDLEDEEVPIRNKAPKSKSSKGHDGLRANWKEDHAELLPPPPAPRSRASSTASSVTGFSAPPTSEYDNTEDDDHALREYRGLMGSDEEQGDDAERKGIQASSGYRFKSIAKIEPVENAPNIFKKAETKSRAKPGRARVSHLPEAVRPKWPSMKITVIDAAGQLPPWADLTDGAICLLWNGLVDQEHFIAHIAGSARGSYVLFQLIKKLVRNVLGAEWKNPFAQAAIDAVAQEWERRELITPASCAKFSEIMLGAEPHNRDSKKARPFMWKATDNIGWDGDDPNKTGGGLFLGRMVLKVFAEHLSHVADAPKELITADAKYSGALMLSIQAVHRALEYTLSGKLSIPTGSTDKTYHFSKENWGDYEKGTVVDGTEYRKPVKRATVFAKTVSALDDTRWKAIIDGAKAYVGKKDSETRVERARVSAAPLLADADAESEDEIILDAMFDGAAIVVDSSATAAA